MRDKTDLLNLYFPSILPLYKKLRNGINMERVEIEMLK